MRRRGRRALPIVVLLLMGVGTAAAAGRTEPVALVDPFAGTAATALDFGTGGGAGNTFPGAVVPFGMLAWSPDTVPGRVNAPGGYSWVDARIRGFSLTHLSGAGCSVLQDVPFLPTTVPITTSPSQPASYDVTQAYLPSFRHDDEQAEPGFYRVVLDPRTERAIEVDLAAATRSAIGRFVFPRTATASVLVNAGGSAMANGDVTLAIDPTRREVSGRVESGQFCYHRNRYTLYFVARFSRAFASHGTWVKQALQPGATGASDHADAPTQIRPVSGIPDPPSTSNGAQAGAWVTFDTRRDREVEVRVAISYVSVEGARRNLRAEIGRRTVGTVRRRARTQWSTLLGRLRVRGGALDDRRTFYTMLYHALLAPTVFSDVDGRYQGMDGVVHDAGARVRYTTFSGWDIYRSEMPLLALLVPERAADMVQSLVENARESGWLPRWSVAAGHTDVMVGDPAAPIIAGAHAFGVRDFDRPAALAAMLKGATQEGTSPNASYVERQGLAGYLARGWVAHDGTEASSGISTTSFGSSSAVWGSAATTLEYATADFAIARFAAALGDGATCRTFVARAGNWRNLFNAATGYLEPRYADGAFPTAFDPGSLEGWAEGNGAQYVWMVPHDVGGLVATMGGPALATRRLDDFLSELNAGPAAPFAYLSNEPCSLTPWLYAWLDRPERTQDVVRRALLTLFDASPAGYAGNDDLGQMSSWYVFGALGLYPAIPGTDVLVLASPLFPKATLRLGGRTLTIVGRGARRDAPYVRGVTLNGHAQPRPWLRFGDLRGRNRLVFDLSPASGGGWGSGPEAPPPSFGPDGSAACTFDRGTSRGPVGLGHAPGGRRRQQDAEEEQGSEGADHRPAQRQTVPVGGSVPSTR